MIRSMTGYSKIRSEEGDFALSIVVKSTNHRFLDVQVRLPSALEPLEPRLRHLVKDYVARGHVEVAVSLERAGVSGLQLNSKLLAAYVTACEKLRREFGFTAPPDPMALLRIPGVIAAGDGEISARELQEIQPVLERAAGETFASLNEMRAQEGEALGRDVRSRLARLKSLTDSISELAQSAPQVYRSRLENRLGDMLGDLGIDPARLAQEVAYLASRADIAEELTRLGSHLDQAKRLVDESPELGKKLDFLLQEMNREANTLLSKTTDLPEVGLEIARQAIEMKTEIEKLREQAQNIE